MSSHLGFHLAVRLSLQKKSLRTEEMDLHEEIAAYRDFRDELVGWGVEYRNSFLQVPVTQVSVLQRCHSAPARLESTGGEEDPASATQADAGAKAKPKTKKKSKSEKKKAASRRILADARQVDANTTQALRKWNAEIDEHPEFDKLIDAFDAEYVFDKWMSMECSWLHMFEHVYG